jgi:hypothetical protein
MVTELSECFATTDFTLEICEKTCCILYSQASQVMPDMLNVWVILAVGFQQSAVSFLLNWLVCTVGLLPIAESRLPTANSRKLLNFIPHPHINHPPDDGSPNHGSFKISTKRVFCGEYWVFLGEIV